MFGFMLRSGLPVMLAEFFPNTCDMEDTWAASVSPPTPYFVLIYF